MTALKEVEKEADFIPPLCSTSTLATSFNSAAAESNPDLYYTVRSTKLLVLYATSPPSP
jgi:hypothetical protein